MLQLIIDILTYSVVEGPVIIAPIDPLTIAGIGAGISALGGLFSSKSNKRTQVGIPSELEGQIDDLSNRNFFLDTLQRAVNSDQGAFNINAGLAARGIDSPMIANEQRQAMESRRQDAIVGGLDQLEGLRLNALQNAIGQMNQLNMANAQFQQQFNDNRLGIIDSAISGVGGSITQGLGAQNIQNLLGQGGNPTGQIGGQGFDINQQFAGSDLNGGIFGGFGGNSAFGDFGGFNNDEIV